MPKRSYKYSKRRAYRSGGISVSTLRKALAPDRSGERRAAIYAAKRQAAQQGLSAKGDANAALLGIQMGERPRVATYRGADGQIRTMTGYGGFWGDLWKGAKKGLGYLPSGTFAAAGGALGGLIGQQQLGRKIGGAVSDISGYGEYGMVPEGNSVPSIVNYHGGTVVRHREYLGNVLASDGFDIKRYQINPGDGAMFPWLKVLAKGFQQYRMRGMMINYKTLSGDSTASANTSIGSVMFATDSDVDTPTPSSKSELLNTEYATDEKPSRDNVHIIECDPSKSRNNGVYHIRDLAPSFVNGTLKDYDYASVFVATQGMQLSGGVRHVIGELWVTYEIELLKPQMLPETRGIPCSMLQCSRNSAHDSENPLGIPLGETIIEPDTHIDNPRTTTMKSVSENPTVINTSGFLVNSNMGVAITCEQLGLQTDPNNTPCIYRITFGDQVRNGVYVLTYTYQTISTAGRQTHQSYSKCTFGTNVTPVTKFADILQSVKPGLVTIPGANSAQTTNTSVIQQTFKLLANDGKRNAGESYIDLAISPNFFSTTAKVNLLSTATHSLSILPAAYDGDHTHLY